MHLELVIFGLAAATETVARRHQAWKLSTRASRRRLESEVDVCVHEAQVVDDRGDLGRLGERAGEQEARAVMGGKQARLRADREHVEVLIVPRQLAFDPIGL